jgi:hypothetical protein
MCMIICCMMSHKALFFFHFLLFLLFSSGDWIVFNNLCLRSLTLPFVWSILITINFFFFFFFGRTAVWAQGFMLARQVLYHFTTWITLPVQLPNKFLVTFSFHLLCPLASSLNCSKDSHGGDTWLNLSFHREKQSAMVLIFSAHVETEGGATVSMTQVTISILPHARPIRAPKLIEPEEIGTLDSQIHCLPPWGETDS